jgi:hypothetical protein
MTLGQKKRWRKVNQRMEVDARVKEDSVMREGDEDVVEY